MKKIALMAAAALIALGGAGSAEAATYSMNTQVNEEGHLIGGFYSPVDGEFMNQYTFNLPFEGRLLSSGISIAALQKASKIKDLTLSLWKGSPGGGTMIDMTTDDTWSNGVQKLDLLFAGNLTANSSYYVQTSGYAPATLGMGGTLNVAPIPVPAALPLFGAALAGLAFYRKKKVKVEEAA